MIVGNLLDIYKSSRLNDGRPECIFNRTKLIFNEDWLIVAVLERWKRWKNHSRFPFLPFPDNAKVYSHCQLYTPFKRRTKEEKYEEEEDKCETNAEVDGIVGNFSIRRKSGIELIGDCRYLAVFEAKVYSELSKRVTNAESYSQVSRAIACIINSILRTGTQQSFDRIYYTVIYPSDSKKIDRTKYTKGFIKSEIQGRLKIYEEGGPVSHIFKEEWEDILEGIDIDFVYWEEILAELGTQDIKEFYELCKEYN